MKIDGSAQKPSRLRRQFWGPLVAILDFVGGERMPPAPLGWYFISFYFILSYFIFFLFYTHTQTETDPQTCKRIHESVYRDAPQLKTINTIFDEFDSPELRQLTCALLEKICRNQL